MPAVTPSQVHEIEERLADREAELRMRVREAKEAQADRPGASGAHVEDLAEEGEQRFRNGIEHVELMRDQEELTDIVATRERIADGSYGECIDCGQDIAPQRLQAQPTATRCLICQGAYEKKHGTTLRYTT
jgi:RNA polymerase-binding transcription factor DksA